MPVDPAHALPQSDTLLSDLDGEDLLDPVRAALQARVSGGLKCEDAGLVAVIDVFL